MLHQSASAVKENMSHNTYCYIFRIAEGKVEEITKYMDTELVTTALGA